MSHGGPRPGAGRKKKRVTDQAVAARVLEKIEAEKAWLEQYEKARRGMSTTEAVRILVYLENRAYGECMHNVNHLHDKPIEMNVSLSLAETIQRARQRVQKA